MKPDLFEQKLASQPWRAVPAAWRRDILAAARAAGSSQPASQPAISLWLQLNNWLWPTPKAWAALAAVWLVLIGLNLGLAGSASKQFQASSAEIQLAINWRHQQRMMLQLLNPEVSPVAPPRGTKPLPRSEAHTMHSLG